MGHSGHVAAIGRTLRERLRAAEVQKGEGTGRESGWWRGVEAGGVG